jgi:nucleotide-binding universal stress UspA family protein
METILFPTDFSDQARQALEYTLTLADKMQARILLLHVFRNPLQTTDTPKEIRANELQFQNTAHRQYEELMESVKELRKNTPVEYHVRNGYLVQEIAAMSKVCRVDLIVMATKGASGLNEITGSSTAAELIEKTHCPVWILPENSDRRAIQQIAVAVNYHDSDVFMLEELVNLASLFDAQLTLLHVMEANQEPETEEVLLLKLQKKVATATGYSQLSQHLLEGNDLVDALNNYLEKNGIDLLVMASREKQMLEQKFSQSKTKQMAYLTRTPLLAFHAYDFPDKAKSQAFRSM